MRIQIVRKKESYDFKADPNKEGSFENNWKNNSLDIFRLYDKNNVCVFACNCQSVANYCFGDYKSNGSIEYGDTIKGKFQVKCFVEPRAFHGRIHAIINAVDLDGQPINESSMQIVDGYQTGRWLIHDKFSFKTNKDTNYAWSAGCIILASEDLRRFNKELDIHGIVSGDIIEGGVEEG